VSFPPDAEMTKRHDEIPARDDMPAVLARQMEIYAGFLEHAWRSTCFRGRLCAGESRFRLGGRMFGVSRVK
jgi:hypothetical protein